MPQVSLLCPNCGARRWRVIIWRVAKRARYVPVISFPFMVNFYLWSTVAIVMGFWFLSRGTHEVWTR
jgi:hypothetical protein